LTSAEFQKHGGLLGRLTPFFYRVLKMGELPGLTQIKELAKSWIPKELS
jgi:hypothetical protein